MSVSKAVRVLVIDDELTQRMLVKEYLEDAGHEVVLSEDGKRGLKLAVSTRPDIILLDYLLPLVDGNSVCKSLKSNPATADIPVILVTASREADVIDKGLAAGAEDFITKPVDWAYLADRVVHVVRKASEKIELTRRLATQVGELPAPEVPASSPDLPGTGIADLMRLAETAVEQSQGALQAEREKLEAEHADALRKLTDTLRAEAEAGHRALVAEYETKVEALAAAHARDIEAAHAAAADAWSAKVSAAEAQAAATAHEIEQKLRRSFSEAMATAASHHEAECARLRERAQLEVDIARSAAHREKLASQREHAEQIKDLRDQLEALTSKASTNDDGIAAALADGDARVLAAWSLSARCAAAQYNLAASVASKINQAAVQSPSTELYEANRFAQALKSLTSGFKILAQAQAGWDEGHHSAVNLSHFVEDVTSQARRVAAERHVSFHVSPVDPGLHVMADSGRFKFALMCLITNAIRFTPAGGAVELSISSCDDGTVRIRLTDNGLGIAPAKLQELQDCLNMPASNSGPAVPETAGLGIPTVHALVRRWSGSLNLDSQIGGGTRAEIVLPVEHRLQSSPRSAA